MSTTIPNLDERAYKALCRRAIAEGRDVGNLLNEAVLSYLAQPGRASRSGTLRDLRPEPYPEGNERLSEEIDAIVYGDRRS